jgi:hypothetical protein
MPSRVATHPVADDEEIPIAVSPHACCGSLVAPAASLSDCSIANCNHAGAANAAARETAHLRPRQNEAHHLSAIRGFSLPMFIGLHPLLEWGIRCSLPTVLRVLLWVTSSRRVGVVADGIAAKNPFSGEVFPMSPCPTLPKSPGWTRVLLVGRARIERATNGSRDPRTIVTQCPESISTVRRPMFLIGRSFARLTTNGE